MRKFALYAAIAAAAMAGTGTMTSQAAMKAYIAGGCTGNWDGGFVSVLPGTLDNPLVPNCFVGGDGNTSLTFGGFGSGTCLNAPGGFLPWACLTTPDCTGSWGCLTVPEGSGSWNCPPAWDCFTGTNCPNSQIPEIQLPGTQTPGTQTPGTQIPGTQTPGTQIPGTQIPGTQTPGTQNQGQVTDQNRSEVQQVINMVNEERAKMGLSPVAEASDVAAAAAVRAREIVGTFAHTRPNGSYYNTALDESGVKYWGSGENIAYGQRTAAEVMDGWMNSQGHKANILNASYTKIGVGLYESSNGVKYWVQLFTY